MRHRPAMPYPSFKLAALGAAGALFASASGAAALTGEAYFKSNCASCHSVDAAVTPGAGPGLAGVIGRQPGAAPGYNYSAAMARHGAAGKPWSAADLDMFLADPAKVVPGTTMPVNIPARADRDAVIAYLGTRKAEAATRASAKAAAAAAAPAAEP